MTPLPKRRWSTRRQGKKRASLNPSSITPRKCTACGKLRPAHTACPNCGSYRGKQVITIKTKTTKVENAN